MVKVISTEPHASVVREVICKNCGSTLSYVPADIEEKTVRDYTGDSDTVRYITCPPCGHEIYISRG